MQVKDRRRILMRNVSEYVKTRPNLHLDFQVFTRKQKHWNTYVYMSVGRYFER